MLMVQGVFGGGELLLDRFPDDSAPVAGWQRVVLPRGILRIAKGHHSLTTSTQPGGALVHERYMAAPFDTPPSKRDGSWMEIRWSSRDLTITTDRLGTIPLYWQHHEGVTWVASRLSDLGAATPVPPEPDTLSMLTTILLEHPWGQSSLLAEVSLLPPASHIRFSPPDERPRSERYWSPPEIPTESAGPLEPWIERTATCLQAAHQRHSSHLCPGDVAMPVTAGLDSRCNLALHPEMARHARLFHCHDLARVEWPFARRIGKSLGRPIERLDSSPFMRQAPEFDPALGPGDFNFGHWRLLGTARQLAESGSRTTIDGFLQDLLFKATFLSERPREQQLQALFGRMTYNAKALGIPADAPLLGALREHLSTIFPVEGSELAISQRHYLENRSRRLVYNIVRTNQNYLDVRTPALDHELMDYAFELPWELRRGSYLYRRVIHRLSPELAAIPYDKTGLPLLDPRPRSWSRTATRQLRHILDHCCPGRSFLKPPEGNFARIARTDPQFRDGARRALQESEWLREVLPFGTPEDVILASHRMGTNAVTCLGGMLTVARLESRIKQARARRS